MIVNKFEILTSAQISVWNYLKTIYNGKQKIVEIELNTQNLIVHSEDKKTRLHIP